MLQPETMPPSGVEALDAADGGKDLDGFDGGMQRDVTFEGVVRRVDMTSFVLDTCLQNVDCATNSIRVTLAVPDLCAAPMFRK